MVGSVLDLEVRDLVGSFDNPDLSWIVVVATLVGFVIWLVTTLVGSTLVVTSLHIINLLDVLFWNNLY